MSLEQLKAFLEKVKGNTSLQEELNAAKSPDEVVAIAKTNGFIFTDEDLQKLEPLEARDLEGLAAGGGTCQGTWTQTPNQGTCQCTNIQQRCAR